MNSNSGYIKESLGTVSTSADGIEEEGWDGGVCNKGERG